VSGLVPSGGPVGRVDRGPAAEAVLVAFDSKRALAGRLAAGVVLAAACLFSLVILGPLAAAVAFPGLLFCAVMTWFVMGRMLARGPALELDAQGIHDRRTGGRKVLWSEVTAVRVVSSGSNFSFLCLWLSDPESYWKTLPRLHRFFAYGNGGMGFGHISVNAIALGRSFEEVCRYAVAALGEGRLRR
jgi:hypothetical protein